MSHHKQLPQSSFPAVLSDQCQRNPPSPHLFAFYAVTPGSSQRKRKVQTPAQPCLLINTHYAAVEYE